MKPTNIFPYTQIRVARPTQSIQKIIEFYQHGLGLPQIGSFDDHGDGISGLMLGLPTGGYHLEFTEHKNGGDCPPPTKDNLLAFYLPTTQIRNQIVQRLIDLDYQIVEPENKYWLQHGITIEDPDKWRVVLMDIASFNTLTH